MKKKKILHIVESFGGGVFSFLVDLVNNTIDQYEIIIAYGLREQTPQNFESYFPNNVKFIKIENFERQINLIKEIRALFEIKKTIKDYNPDIVHLHSSKAGFLGRFATNCKKKKVIYNPHGFSFLMKDNFKIKRIIYWLIEKSSTIKKCIIVACSKGEYEEALKLSKNSICINNGIDILKLENEIKDLKENNIDYNNLKICIVGRIDYQKNPKMFNEIAQRFSKFSFTWIGDGKLKTELTNHKKKVTGWKSRKEVLKILNDNDIFILTSLWEGLPISLLEAMYLKKICIVSNCIGNRDIIQNKENGYIANNVDEFENIIKSINTGCTNIAKKAKEDVINNYNIKIMSESYKKLYN